MTTKTLATRYATAFTRWVNAPSDQLPHVQALQATLQENTALSDAFCNPTLPQQAKTHVATDVLKALKASEELTTFVALIAQDNRLSALEDILKATTSALKTELGIEDVRITSAAPLTDAQKKDLLQTLSKSSEAKELNLVETTDARLLGGFTVQQGSVLHDFSVKGQLAALQKHLAS